VSVHRGRLIAAVVLIILPTLLAGCASAPATVAALGITRSERGAVVAIVRVCEGAAAGIQLSTSADPGLVLGAKSQTVTTWTSPDPVTAVAATDLVGATFWPADPEIEGFAAGTLYTMTVFSDVGITAAAPLTFTLSAFDSLSGDEVLTGDPDTGLPIYVDAADFFDAACDVAA
jgi:hypothetical protein